MRQVVLGIACTNFAIGCIAPTPPTPNNTRGLIRTESQSYTAIVSATTVRLTVVAKFANTTNDKLTLHPCVQQPRFAPMVRLERYQDGKWRTVVAPVCTEALMLNPPRLLPGEIRTDTVYLEGYRTDNWFPKFPPGPVAGVYRLAYSDIYRTWNEDNVGPPVGALGAVVPDSLLRSNPFRVKE